MSLRGKRSVFVAVDFDEPDIGEWASVWFKDVVIISQDYGDYAESLDRYWEFMNITPVFSNGLVSSCNQILNLCSPNYSSWVFGYLNVNIGHKILSQGSNLICFPNNADPVNAFQNYKSTMFGGFQYVWKS